MRVSAKRAEHVQECSKWRTCTNPCACVRACTAICVPYFANVPLLRVRLHHYCTAACKEVCACAGARVHPCANVLLCVREKNAFVYARVPRCANVPLRVREKNALVYRRGHVPASEHQCTRLYKGTAQAACMYVCVRAIRNVRGEKN